MTAITTRLYTKLFGQIVGADEFGNVYYTEKKQPRDRKAKRWVVYNGLAEPSKVPAEWHGWLHYTLDAPITNRREYNWEKSHLPNLTGTTGAYLPAGHLLKGGRRAPSTSDYEPWKP